MKYITISIKDLLDKRLNPHNKMDFKTARKIYETLKARYAKKKVNNKKGGYSG